MKLLLFQAALYAAAAAGIALGGAHSPAQAPAQTPAQTPVQAPVQAAPPAQTPTKPDAQPEPPAPSSGKVIFSRSTDENGNETTQAGADAAAPKVETADKALADDAARLSVAVTALDLDVHLDTAEHAIAVRAQVTVRNSGATPLKTIPLQISSTLKWERVRVGGQDVSFPVAKVNSDADHTGQLNEAAIPLATPLAPGATLTLDTVYSGTIEATAQRLVAIGTPEEDALHNDWDEITPEFTGLRGFGNVVWYPVASVPQFLGGGAKLFDEIGRQKLAISRAHVHIRLTAEFPHDAKPTIAVLCGHAASLQVTDAQGANPGFPGVATAEIDLPALGFEAPSLFLAERKAHSGVAVAAWATEDNNINVEKWLDAAGSVKPFVEYWLGTHPRGALTLLDLPEAADAPFETGSLVAAPLGDADNERLNGVLVHAMTHAWTQAEKNPAPAWLNEGFARFMETLWVEHKQGRDAALGLLEADRAALALAEPASPGDAAGLPLEQATAPIYYRTKAAYVLWMLRDLVGDDALGQALRDYEPQPGDSSAKTLLALLRGAGATRDLSWFFSDWIENDKGLPDLSIADVFPHPGQNGTVVTAVNVNNTGYAACEVTVTVRTAKGSQTERLFVPARGHAVDRVLVLGQPTSVQVNDGTVPETGASVHVTTLEDAAVKAGSRE